jgi:hypothetical protein
VRRLAKIVAFERRCIRVRFVALLAPYSCEYASVARLADRGASTFSVLHAVHETAH